MDNDHIGIEGMVVRLEGAGVTPRVVCNVQTLVLAKHRELSRNEKVKALIDWMEAQEYFGEVRLVVKGGEVMAAKFEENVVF